MNKMLKIYLSLLIIYSSHNCHAAVKDTIEQVTSLPNVITNIISQYLPELDLWKEEFRNLNEVSQFYFFEYTKNILRSPEVPFLENYEIDNLKKGNLLLYESLLKEKDELKKIIIKFLKFKHDIRLKVKNGECKFVEKKEILKNKQKECIKEYFKKAEYLLQFYEFMSGYAKEKNHKYIKDVVSIDQLKKDIQVRLRENLYITL